MADLIVDGFFSYLSFVYMSKSGCYIEVDGVDHELSKEQEKELPVCVRSQDGNFSFKSTGIMSDSLASHIS
jgi:hypothetical protein